MESENPWIALRPPATDPMTYLVFVEHNLSVNNLGNLQDALADDNLTKDIGWDLVIPLLSLVPDSQPCLVQIARVGNPREVLLKVTEALRLLELDGMEDPSLAISDDEERGDSSVEKAPDLPPELELPIPVRQFQMLIQMLSMLYPRIHTKQPYRFLSATLQAILVAFGRATQCHAELAQEIIALVKTISGTKRPHLPKRGSSSHILTSTPSATAVESEAPAQVPSAEHAAMQKRLMQSALTHVLEDYMLSLHSKDDVPGMAWSSRLQEKLYPERQIQNRQTYAARFAADDKLQNRVATVGQIAALTQDLDLESQDLLDAVVDPTPEPTGQAAEEEPPEKPEDIPLSKTGALFLLCARKSSEAFYGSPSNTPAIPLFPTHAAIQPNFVGRPSRASAGLEHEAVLDALLFLGLQAVETNNLGTLPASRSPATFLLDSDAEDDTLGDLAVDDDPFAAYLQTTSLLSANAASPSLRFHAHYLTTSVLRSHPDARVRLAFIRDTLQHCPFAALRASAVSWLKGETVEAATATAAPEPPTSVTASNAVRRPAPGPDSADRLFATPAPLRALAPSLFPDLRATFEQQPGDALADFLDALPFTLAALNFLLLLLRAKHLQGPLDVLGMLGGDEGEAGVVQRFVRPLKEAVGVFRRELEKEREEKEVRERFEAELGLVELAVGRVEEALEAI